MPIPFLQLRLDEAAGPLAADQRNTTPRRTIAGARTVILTGGANYNPSALYAANGDLLIFCARGGTVNNNTNLYSIRCPSGSDPMLPASWGAPVLVANHHADPAPQNFGVGCATLLTDGSICLAYNTFDVGAELDGQVHSHTWTRRSTDNGLTWTAPYAITQAIFQSGYDNCSIYGAPFELPGGDLLLPIYTADTLEDWQSQGAAGPFSNIYVRLLKSTDRGASWAFYTIPFPKDPALAYTESWIVRLPAPDGRLMLLNRTHQMLGGTNQGHCRASFSSDNGATWTRPRQAFYNNWNTPSLNGVAVNGDEFFVCTRAVNAGDIGASPPLFLGMKGDGARWSQRQELSHLSGQGQQGGAVLPYGAGQLLVITCEGHPLLANDIVIYTMSAPATRPAGDNPGTAAGNVTFNQAPVLSGTASVYVATNGFLDVPTSPVLESVAYGPKPRLRLEAEIRPDAPPAGNTIARYIACLKSGTLPAMKLAFYLYENFGTRTLRADVSDASGTYTVTSAGGLFNTGTAYQVAVELDDTTVRLYRGTAAGVFTLLTTSVAVGTPRQMEAHAPVELILRLGNDSNLASPFKGNLANVTLTGLPTIGTLTLPDGQQGVAYSQALAAAGGTFAYTWSISGGALPAGLTLNATTGVISGTPTASGTASFTVTVTDSSGWTDSQALSLTIAGAAALAITTTTLPAGQQGVPYSQALAAVGGSGGYTWAVTAGSLPAGLSLNPATGVISGTPTASGTASFTVTVTDGASATDGQALSLTVAVGVPVLAGIAPTGATAGDPGGALAVTGSMFNAACVVYWDETALVTTYVSPTALTAAVPAGLLAAAGTAQVTVRHPVAGTSLAAAPFTVVAGPPPPTPLPPGTVIVVGSGAYYLLPAGEARLP